jgi:uncharacterized protein YoaH (UPF0181 family)
MNASSLDELKSLTRKRIRLLWQQANLGGTFSGEDAHLVQAMRDHPKYTDLWGHLDELSDEQIERDGTNPIMYINIRTTVESQIADGDPPITGETVQALMRQGLSRHEAIHRVGTVLAEEIYHILKDKRDYDQADYAHKLKQLVEPNPTRLPRRKAKGRYR